ncbi:hypothetical protein [Sulfuriferula sp.]|uniref:hypothetical protein n=1 Tax=Sulfuriferula sp. TaxID=2025307 RepID=UPI002730DB35|nr:hypothetical protein [Sulfuriferula sp.]MDP2027350.1 hypothetical protein [Sulfuriferula sp.]
MLGKPGYGLFTEAAVNAVPLLYLRRVDWLEERYLIAWLQRHGCCLEVSSEAIERGALVAALRALWAQSSRPPLPSNGAQQVVKIVATMLADKQNSAT